MNIFKRIVSWINDYKANRVIDKEIEDWKRSVDSLPKKKPSRPPFGGMRPSQPPR